jgi:hypothetical protein
LLRARLSFMEGQSWQGNTDLAADFAKMQLTYGLQGPQTPQQTTPYKPEPSKWEHSPGRSQQSPSARPQQGVYQHQQQISQNLGWGGETIPEGAHRIPCEILLDSPEIRRLPQLQKMPQTWMRVPLTL